MDLQRVAVGRGRGLDGRGALEVVSMPCALQVCSRHCVLSHGFCVPNPCCDGAPCCKWLTASRLELQHAQAVSVQQQLLLCWGVRGAQLICTRIVWHDGWQQHCRCCHAAWYTSW
jgi:hypothetical protein